MLRKAFTLLEILVSTVLISMIMFGIMSGFIGIGRYISISRSETVAGQLARFFLGELPQQVRQDNWNTSCLGGNSSNCSNGETTMDNTVYGVIYNVTAFNESGGDFANLSKVELSISWNETTF
ncbi:MAG: type II secretion system protein [Candidatus Omnitrophica bacterium]|nr:type II secretion system protein [Candidatus Omnitrophota bacterium]